MAARLLKKASPYKNSNLINPPKEDVKYAKYLEELKLDNPISSETYGFALYGVGRAGTIHLSFLIKDQRVNLLYIVEDDISKWDKLKRYWNLKDVKFLTSKDDSQVFSDPLVRAVVVCSPTITHERIVKTALQNEKAVFCEKPISGSNDQIIACYEKAAEVSQPLLSAFNRRFDPAYNAIRDKVRDGEIGKVLTVKTTSRDSPLPSIEYLKISGRIFHDCAVHDIDLILYILEEYPSKVSVMAKANIPEIAAINDYDTVAITLSFESGALGIIDLSRHSSYGYDQRLEVFGTDGMLKSENTTPLQSLEKFTSKSVEKAPIYYSFPSKYEMGYYLEMEHFLNVLSGKEGLLIKAKDTLAVTKIADACEESIKSGKIVEIKWSRDEL